MSKVRADNVESKARSRVPGIAALALAFVATLFAGQAASAQIPSGYSGSSTTGTMDNGEAWRTLVIFGRCYAEHNQADAFALLATEPDSPQERETYRRLFRRDTQFCLGGGTSLTVRIGYVRGAIVEGLHRRATPVPAALVQPEPARDTPVRTLSGVARCYVATHRAEVQALLQTPVGSPREQEAMNAMSAELFQCVPEPARGRSFDMLMLRFRLAEALLRMAPPATLAGRN